MGSNVLFIPILLCFLIAWWNIKQPNVAVVTAAAAVILSWQQQQHDPDHGYGNVRNVEAING